MNTIKCIALQIVIGMVMIIHNPVIGESFNFKRWLFGGTSTLSVFVSSIDSITGEVVVSGADTQQPSEPFTWNWGDGTVEDAWFPATHIYSDVTRNYVITVTAHYPDGTADFRDTLIQFVPIIVNPQPLPPELLVTIPQYPFTLDSRMPYPIPTLTFSHDSIFGEFSRSTIEYILSVFATIEMDLVNDNVYRFNDKFEQVVFKKDSGGGMLSHWYTDPVSFSSGEDGFQGIIEWSSCMHEMGHNVTLNSPADYFYGGKIDGNANAIFSETMAQIFQHTTAYILLNNYSYYGIHDDLAYKIKESAILAIQILRNSYDSYIQGGMNFTSWNLEATPHFDEAFGTFMTIAYKFCEHAENSGQGYQIPLKRMMKLLQVFNPDLEQQYDRLYNTPEAELFRATLMVTAMSYGFSTDLREEFRNLNFPISDEIYDELMNLVNGNIEAEDMVHTNYIVENRSEASNGKVVKLNSYSGNIRTTFSQTPGMYTIGVTYVDEDDGDCSFNVYVNDTKIDEWNADQTTSDWEYRTRNIEGVNLATDDVIKIEGIINNSEYARLDYIELIPETTVDEVCWVYQHCWYGGYWVGLTPGSYTLNELQAKGMLNDDLSSIQIEQGYKITIYQHDNFGGYSTVITEDDDCLNNNYEGRSDGNDWNDDISSVKVEPIGTPTYTITASAGSNGSISPSGSITVNGGDNKTFIITPNAGYTIEQVIVNGIDQGAISTYTFNNVSAHHTIHATFIPVTEDVCWLYQHCWYGGYYVGLPLGIYTLSELQALGIQNDDLSSIKVLTGYKVTLYQHDNFGGYSIEFNVNDNCLNNNHGGRSDGNNWNDDVSSVKVEAIGD